MTSKGEFGSMSHRERSGITLVEMLIVLAIASLIIALTAAASMAVLGRQKANNTTTLFNTIGMALEQHWRSVVEDAKKETVPDWANTMAGGDGRRARVIWIKARLKQEFPMNFTEAWTHPVYGAALQSLGVTLPLRNPPQGNPDDPNQADPTQASENSVCLLLALQQTRKNVSFDLNAMGSSITDGNYVNPGSPAGAAPIRLKQIIDGWGQPIAFYRFPTGYQDLNPGGPISVTAPPFPDSLDPEGLLSNAAWLLTSGAADFQTRYHALGTPAGGVPHAYRLVPIIASAGPNHAFEIAGPASATKPDPMNTIAFTSSDDVYSNRVRSLGSKGN